MTAAVFLVPSDHRYEDLIELFNGLFQHSYNCILVRGDDEPVYLPADEQHPHHRIIFAHGYFASALHEISHWCIAGAERRLLEDFGYWYQPDGRTAAQQAVFEQVEVKPQALEWIFSRACGCRFRVSTDNLHGEPTDNSAFKRAVHTQVGRYLLQGIASLPERPRQLVQALCDYYRQPLPQANDFKLQDLSL